jgi:hypothetical protein
MVEKMGRGASVEGGVVDLFNVDFPSSNSTIQVVCYSYFTLSFSSKRFEVLLKYYKIILIFW